jgi:hypothetical protein
VLFLFALAPRAAAQSSQPPGPWVIDLRGATAGLPADTAFFPPITVDTLVPSRGFGLDVGGHVYLLSWGPSRVGVGVSYVRVRGTATTVAATVGAFAPQVSFNFGTRNGWSYLGAGWGRAWVRTTAEQLAGTAERESGALAAVNFGGGARWFLTRHVGVGFDVRWHRLSGTPRTMLLTAAAGVSIH